MIPETKYAKSGNVHIAYQVIGEGPFDLVFFPGFISHVEHVWENPRLAELYRRLALFSRLIIFDKRGTGLSDREINFTLEQRMDDVRAVMDAVGSEQAAIFGISEGGAMAALFAATYPSRTRALVLYGAYPHYPTYVLSGEKFETFVDFVEKSWGTGESLRYFAPEASHIPEYRTWWARFERLAASPSAVVALQRMNHEIDVRNVLSAIRVPTLVLHRAGDTRVKVEGGRYLAEHIPHARYVELPGVDHALSSGGFERIVDEIEEFLTGSRAVPELDRVLATIMVTDIVDSSRRASELGDRKWRSLLESHNQIVRHELGRFRGHEIKTLGDGFLATFEGPARAVRCAAAIETAVHPIGLEVRAGVHTGEIELMGGDIGGIGVHIAVRIAALADADEVLVSSTVKDLVAGSGLRFADRGTRALKGIEGDVRLFAAEGA